MILEKCSYCCREVNKDLLVNGLCPSCLPLMQRQYDHEKAMKHQRAMDDLERNLSYDDEANEKQRLFDKFQDEI